MTYEPPPQAAAGVTLAQNVRRTRTGAPRFWRDLRAWSSLSFSVVMDFARSFGVTFSTPSAAAQATAWT